MKRNIDDKQGDKINEENTKMSRSDDSIEVRFLVPSKAAGVIIGKGGENIKEVRDRFDMKVNIADSPGPERVLQLVGSIDQIFGALEHILEKGKNCMPASESDIYTESRSRRRNRSRGDEDNEDECGVDLRMLIHHSQAGGVIGRGGERIKELRENMSMKTLKVYQDQCPNSTDRIIQMVGDMVKVIRCVRTVMDFLESFPPRGSEHPYDAKNYRESQALSYGGWLTKQALKNVEQFGASALRSPSGTGSRSNGSMMSPSGQGRGGVPPNFGGLANQQMMMGMIMQGGQGVGRSGMVGHFAAQGSPPTGSFNMNFPDGPVKTIQVSVPNAYMGAIMGRGGIKIRSIRENSQADIRVYEADKNGSDRIIDITGTPQQIALAQQLLKSSVKRS